MVKKETDSKNSDVSLLLKHFDTACIDTILSTFLCECYVVKIKILKWLFKAQKNETFYIKTKSNYVSKSWSYDFLFIEILIKKTTHDVYKQTLANSF